MELKWLPTSVSFLRFDGRGVWLVVNSEQDVWWHWRRRRRRVVRCKISSKPRLPTEGFWGWPNRGLVVQDPGQSYQWFEFKWCKPVGRRIELCSIQRHFLFMLSDVETFGSLLLENWSFGLYNVSLLIVGLEPPTIGIGSQHSDTLSYPLTFEAHPPARSSFIFGPFNFKNWPLSILRYERPTSGFSQLSYQLRKNNILSSYTVV